MQFGRMKIRTSPAGNYGNVMRNIKSKMYPLKKKRISTGMKKFGFGKKGGY